jgi:hypothetical protein
VKCPLSLEKAGQCIVVNAIVRSSLSIVDNLL